MKDQSQVEVEEKKWTNFVLNSGNFQISTPLPRVVTWLCHVTAASKFYNPSNLNFDVSDSFGVGKIQTLYGIWLETIFRTQRWRWNFHLELASTKVGPTPSIILNQIPQLLSKISGSEQRVVLDQNRSSEANLAVRIFIWARLPRRLTKVNYSSYKNLQNRETGLKPKRTTRRPNSQCQQVINDLGSLQECSIRGKEFFNLKMTWRVITISTTKRTFVRERKESRSTWMLK